MNIYILQKKASSFFGGGNLIGEEEEEKRQIQALLCSVYVWDAECHFIKKKE